MVLFPIAVGILIGGFILIVWVIKGALSKPLTQGCSACSHTGSMPCSCDAGYHTRNGKVTRCLRCMGNGVVSCVCKR
jgi:hypothetical protein